MSDMRRRELIAALGGAAAGNAGDRVLKVALQPVVSARLAVSIVVIRHAERPQDRGVAGLVVGALLVTIVVPVGQRPRPHR